MKRIDYIRAMTAEEMAEKIRDIVNLELDDYCKSDCEASRIANQTRKKANVKCCIRWLESEMG